MAFAHEGRRDSVPLWQERGKSPPRQPQLGWDPHKPVGWASYHGYLDTAANKSDFSSAWKR